MTIHLLFLVFFPTGQTQHDARVTVDVTIKLKIQLFFMLHPFKLECQRVSPFSCQCFIFHCLVSKTWNHWLWIYKCCVLTHEQNNNPTLEQKSHLSRGLRWKHINKQTPFEGVGVGTIITSMTQLPIMGLSLYLEFSIFTSLFVADSTTVNKRSILMCLGHIAMPMWVLFLR